MGFYDPQKFAEWLTNAYKQSRYKSWQEVADAVKTTRSTLSRYAGAKPQSLTGKPSQPDPELVVRLAKVFDDNVDKVLQLAGHAPINSPLLPEELAIIDYGGFDKDDLKDIADYVAFKRAQKLKEMEGKK